MKLYNLVLRINYLACYAECINYFIALYSHDCSKLILNIYILKMLQNFNALQKIVMHFILHLDMIPEYCRKKSLKYYIGMKM